MKKKYYLAYGANLNVEDMRERCPFAKPVGTAVIQDYELLYKGVTYNAFLTIEPKINSQVPVAVWEITEDDEKQLDIYEDYPALYYKKEMELTVALNNGKTEFITAFIYIMYENRKLSKPDSDYIHLCEEGYRNFGFDLKILNDAYQKSIAADLT